MISELNKTLKDKNDIVIKDDDVLFDGKIHWRFCVTKTNGTYLLSCEMGYDHDVSQEHLINFIIIGTFKGKEHLFNCD